MTLNELNPICYLADGVYVGRDSIGILWLVTSNGIETTNAICMEPEVIESFLKYLSQEKKS